MKQLANSFDAVVHGAWSADWSDHLRAIPIVRGIWELRRPVAVRLARLAARPLVSAALLTPVGRARSNQIGDAYPWRALQRLGTPGMRQIREHEGCPTALPGPARWAALVFKTSGFAVGIATWRNQQAPRWLETPCGSRSTGLGASRPGMRRRSAMARCRLVSRPAPVPGRSERCSCAPQADPWLPRDRSAATRSTSACPRVGPRRGAPGPVAGQAPCGC